MKQFLPKEPKEDYDMRRYFYSKELDLCKYMHIVSQFMGENGNKHRLGKNNPNEANSSKRTKTRLRSL